MNFKSATDAELNIILHATGDYTRAQNEGAEYFTPEKCAKLPEDMRDIPERMRAHAIEADALRNGAATELHIRGKIACALAHPNHPVCPWGVDA